MTDPDVVHDPQVLRAIAHPVRNRILEEAQARGSIRAADVARELDIPANQASFHLRQLAKYGLVEEDPTAARDKRDRVWRPVSRHGLTIDLGELESAPGGRAAAAVFRRSSATWGHLVVERAYSGERRPGEHQTVNQTALRLSTEEAKELADEVGAVIERWSERTQGDDPSRSTYLYFGVVQPYPALADAERDGS